MSYDLFFKGRDAAAAPRTAAEFTQYFSSRPRYRVDGTQAWYGNPDTGVSFSFQLVEADQPEDGAEDADMAEPDAWAHFELAYARPHFFALEAIEELTAFVAAFDLVVDDPQAEESGVGEFVAARFIANWTAGNQAAVSAIELPEGARFSTLPAATLEAVWRWNFRREAFQQELGAKIFVPRIVFFKRGERPQSGIVWTDAIPAVLPQTDFVVLWRERLAPRKFFMRATDFVVVDWSVIAPFVSSFPRTETPLPFYTLRYEKPPTALLDFVTGQPPSTVKPEALRHEHVLSDELAARA
ncbi:MAG: hypothetical protein ACKVX7_19570 [Planctomycetota bacterium]